MAIFEYQTKEDFKKLSNIALLATVGIFIYCFYVFYLGYYFNPGNYFNKIVLSIHKTFTPQTYLILKLLPLVFLLCTYLIWTTTRTIDKIKKEFSAQMGLLFISFYVILGIVEVYVYNGYLTLVLSFLFFFLGIYYALESKKMLAVDLKEDRRNIIESQFDQKREKIDTEYSVNIPYRYMYQGQLTSSWINVVNPFRASLIGGTPGSGKSFAIIEEYMRQFTMKGFTGLLYDFKYPTLTVKQYNYLNWYKDKYKVKPKFYVINFDDVAYSNRCNPVSAEELKTLADADEATKNLMLNINKTWIEKEGDFFTDSANVYTSMLLWYLKLVSEKYKYDVCSLPHLIALSTFESTEIMFFILNKYSDLKPKMRPFSEALEKGALEQLAGQVASAGVALAKISSPEIFYILTGNDFNFHLNDPLSPKILCVGNNPDKSVTYAAPLALVMAKAMRGINQIREMKVNGESKKVENAPSFFMVDEFPTVFLRGIDNLIATARSNKVGVALGFQSFAQITADYSKDVADKILRICGTRIMGQMLDDDAETISKNIGKHKILTRSYNYSSSDVSKNEQTQLEEIVPPERITQFSQGTFTGVIADDFKYKDDNKVFYGEVIPEIELKSIEDKLTFGEVYDFRPDDLKESVELYKSKFHKYFKRLLSFYLEIYISDLVDAKMNLATLKGVMINELRNIEGFIDVEEEFFNGFDLMNLTNKVLFLKEKEGSESIELSEKILWNNIETSIEDGHIENNKQKILKEYSHSIYNDVYRIIAMEIEDLNVLEEFKEAYPKNYENMTKLFNKIARNENLNDEIIKQKYLEFSQTIETE